MSKYFKENGFLSEEGARLIEDFNFGVAATFIQDAVKQMSETELRTLGANLSKIIGDQVSSLITAKNYLSKNLNEMTDEQFEAFMKIKYGDKWMLVAIAKEEMDRVRKMVLMTDEQIREAMAKGAAAKEEYLKTVHPFHTDPGLRFK